jgi:hypothetical protein
MCVRCDGVGPRTRALTGCTGNWCEKVKQNLRERTKSIALLGRIQGRGDAPPAIRAEMNMTPGHSMQMLRLSKKKKTIVETKTN